MKYSLDKNIKEVYLTHFVISDDPLVYLIEDMVLTMLEIILDVKRYIKVIDEKEVKKSVNNLIGEKSL